MINLGHAEANLILMEDQEGNKFNILVDGGSEKEMREADGNIINTDSITRILPSHGIHGIVISHIDDDHIGGIINMLNKFYSNVRDKLKIVFVIFNKYISHTISFKQGDRLERLIRSRMGENIIISSYQTKYIEENKNIAMRSDEIGEVIGTEILSLKSRMMIRKLSGDFAYITLLTPDRDDLNSFMEEWKEYKRKKKKGSGKIINNSSIAFLLEYTQKRVVFTGDVTMQKISKAIDCIDATMKIECLKLCHHGAYENNIGIEDFIKKHNCRKIIYCTNGNNYKEHPDIGIIHNIINLNPIVMIYATNRINEDCIREQIGSYFSSYKFCKIHNEEVQMEMRSGNALRVIDRKKLADILKKVSFDKPGFERIKKVLKVYFDGECTSPIYVEKQEVIDALMKVFDEEFSQKIHVQEGEETIEI